MIAKRLKNLSRIGILIAIRQIYFLGRNIYELYYSPYLTLKKIIKDWDKSQIFLILLASITPVLIYILARIIWDLIMYHQVLWLTSNVFVVMGAIQVAILVYLGYWTIRVLGNREK
jgi:hypothetical protein